MSTDLGEKKNLYKEKPEMVASLLAQLEKDIKRGRSTKGPRSKNDLNDIKIWKSGQSKKN
jgi:hypothetical protein